jgi:RNA polymerase sigma-70 factor, ECF subfamily
MAAPTVATDESLASGFQGGDERAFEALVDRYYRPLYHFAYRLLGHAEDAEDATQDAFVQIYRALPAAHLDLPLRPWLYRILRNRCLDLLKLRRSVSFADLSNGDVDEVAGPAVVDGNPLPDELAERADLQRLLTAAIAALAPPYREVVALRYTADLQFGEIADVLGLPENTVKTRFQRAKPVLRHALRDLAARATADSACAAPTHTSAGPRIRQATEMQP